MLRSCEGWVLKLDPEAVDALRFSALTERARCRREQREADAAAGESAEATGLWRGDALIGLADAGYLTAHAVQLRRSSPRRHWHVVSAEDGETALELFTRGRPYTDINMPVMDKFALAQSIPGGGWALIVALSATSSREKVEGVQPTGPRRPDASPSLDRRPGGPHPNPKPTTRPKPNERKHDINRLLWSLTSKRSAHLNRNAQVQGACIVQTMTLRRVVTLGSIALTTLLWQASPSQASLTGATGNVQTLDAAPTDVSPEALTSGTQAFVFRERKCASLAADLPVDVLNPAGTYGEASTQPGVLSTGTQVDSYYVHFDQPGEVGTASVTGTLTFDQPVLGIVFLTSTLDATDAALGAPGTTYPPAPSYLRGYEAATGDTVQVSADGLTVTFSPTTAYAQDELRIITQGTCLPTDPEQCKEGGWEAFGFKNQGQCVSSVLSQHPTGPVSS